RWDNLDSLPAPVAPAREGRGKKPGEAAPPTAPAEGGAGAGRGRCADLSPLLAPYPDDGQPSSATAPPSRSGAEPPPLFLYPLSRFFVHPFSKEREWKRPAVPAVGRAWNAPRKP